MSNGAIVFAVIMLCAAGGAAGLVFYVRHKIRGFSRSMFGTDSLTEGWKKQETELAETPCSVAGMTRIYEPQIHKDFPEFNWVQFRNKAENVLKLALGAITAGSIGMLQECSEALKEQVDGQIRQNEREGVREVYEQIRVHQTEITRYEKKMGRCIITLQSAVEYIHYKEQGDKIISGRNDLKKQTKYNIELMYIQDEQQANGDHGVGLHCPNCGAPIRTLGAKHCEYCGSEVTPINMQVWSLQHYYEVTYQKV